MDWYMKKFPQICIGTILALAVVSLAQAATYKWVDKDGHVHYSSQPPADANYEKLKLPSQGSSSSSTHTQSGPTYTTPATGSNGTSSEVIKKEEAKAEEIRQKNCEQAKKALETYTVYRRIRDKDGNVVYLDDNERAKRIADAKAGIKEFCE